MDFPRQGLPTARASHGKGFPRLPMDFPRLPTARASYGKAFRKSLPQNKLCLYFGFSKKVSIFKLDTVPLVDTIGLVHSTNGVEQGNENR
jgi:hypothetical protein